MEYTYDYGLVFETAGVCLACILVGFSVAAWLNKRGGKNGG